MLTYQTFFKAELKRLISEEIERLKENLVVSHNYEGFDFLTFKYQVGIIEGLRKALELCDEAERTADSA